MDPYDHPEFEALVAGLRDTHAVGVCHDWLRDHGWDGLADVAGLPWAVEWGDERVLGPDGRTHTIRSGRLTARPAGRDLRDLAGRHVGPLWATEAGTGRRWLVPRAAVSRAEWQVGGPGVLTGGTLGVCYETPGPAAG